MEAIQALAQTGAKMRRIAIALPLVLMLSGCAGVRRPVMVGASAPTSPAPVSSGAPAPTIACTPSPNVVQPGETVTIHCTAANPQNRPVSYFYAATAGSIAGSGPVATLNLAGVVPGSVRISAVVTGPGGSATAEMVVHVLSPQVMATAPPPPVMATMPPPPPMVLAMAAPPPAPILDTGRDFLLSSQHEKPGYGLYSYLLWWNVPSEQDRSRYLSVISAFLSITSVEVEEGAVPAVDAQGHPAPAVDVVQPRNLNVAYIPVTSPPPQGVTAEWVLDHYDVTRARLLLHRIPKSLHSGPYIVSMLHPLQTRLAASDHVLFQDLSSPAITNELAAAWIRQFQVQASKQQFWRPNMMTNFVLDVRGQVAELAVDIPSARTGLASWIQWYSPPGH